MSCVHVILDEHCFYVYNMHNDEVRVDISHLFNLILAKTLENMSVWGTQKLLIATATQHIQLHSSQWRRTGRSGVTVAWLGCSQCMGHSTQEAHFVWYSSLPILLYEHEEDNKSPHPFPTHESTLYPDNGRASDSLFVTMTCISDT